MYVCMYVCVCVCVYATQSYQNFVVFVQVIHFKCCENRTIHSLIYLLTIQF